MKGAEAVRLAGAAMRGGGRLPFPLLRRRRSLGAAAAAASSGYATTPSPARPASGTMTGQLPRAPERDQELQARRPTKTAAVVVVVVGQPRVGAAAAVSHDERRGVGPTPTRLPTALRGRRESSGKRMRWTAPGFRSRHAYPGGGDSHG
ncbi:unnamed protein product, partial [Ectocarpus sp. 13 AM-2016]